MTYDADLLGQTITKPSGEKFSRALSEKTKARKREHLSFLVTQCFNTMDTFGKVLSDSIKLHIDHLSEFTTDEMSAAFETWVRSNTRIPMPADIRDLILSAKVKASPVRQAYQREPIAWQQYVYDWNTNEFIETFYDGAHLSPIEMDRRYGARRIFVRMGRQT